MAAATNFGAGNSGFQAGIVNGDVHTEFHHHALPERHETPPPSSAIIPFGRDRDFVPRGQILDRLDGARTQAAWTALVGLGGVGKSQIAIEFAYRTREQSSETWVFWVHASNKARFEQSFREIADYLKIHGRHDPKANIFRLMRDWLRNRNYGKWVLTLDNVDNASFLTDVPNAGLDGDKDDCNNQYSHPLKSYLPHCQHGTVLITSRSKAAALSLVEAADIIEIESMNSKEAIRLIENKLGQQNDKESIAALASVLEHMPLALVQATAYINQRAPRCSVRKYVENFRKSDLRKASLLNYEGGQLRRDPEAKNSIIITWQISFDHIREIRPSAADLLSLVSSFDHQGIPESLLRDRSGQKSIEEHREQHRRVYTDGASSGDDTESDLSDSNGFEEDILVLRDYSLISVEQNILNFEMHSLVQLATRRWLEAHSQQEIWKQRFIHRLYEDYPTGEYENWAMCQALLPHAKSAAAQAPEEEGSLRDWASILYKAAWYLRKVGNGSEAEKMAVKAMEVRQKILENNDPDTLSSMAMVGSVYRFQGRWEEAEELDLQVMETSKAKLGADHPFTLISMDNLASTYWNQGRWEEAEKLGLQVMEARKVKLGADYVKTLTSIDNLASTYWNQDRWEEAEKLDVLVMEARKVKLGADHVETLTSIGNLASTYWKQGRWEEAEKLGVQVMETLKAKLGVDHPSTLISMDNLAYTWNSQGHAKKAINLVQESVFLSQQRLGLDHPHTVSRIKIADKWQKAFHKI